MACPLTPERKGPGAVRCRYVTEGSRISFAQETSLGLLTADEAAAGVERRRAQAAAAGGSPAAPEFHFICEVRPRPVLCEVPILPVP